MSQTDYNIANGSGAAVRSDLNAVFGAIQSNNSDADAPAAADSVAYQWWADTDEPKPVSGTGVMRIRDTSTDTLWHKLFALDGSSLPSFTATELCFNEAGADLDFRIEGDTEANLFFIDAGNDRVGIGNNAPVSTLDVTGAITSKTGTAGISDQSITFTESGSGNAYGVRLGHTSNTELAFERYDGGWAETVRIDGAGRVGIGTSTPNYELHVHDSGTGTVDSRIHLTNGDTGTGGGDGFHIIANGSTANYGVNLLNRENGPLALWTNNVERLRITDSGTIQLKNSAGIDFSQIQTNKSGMSSETLDSYEEGSWTPSLQGSSSTGTASYSYQQGCYTKIGNTVLLRMIVAATISGAAGNMEITGIPFTPQYDAVGSFQFNYGPSWGTNVGMYTSYLGSGQTTMLFRGTQTNGANYEALTIGNVSFLRVHMQYQVS